MFHQQFIKEFFLFGGFGEVWGIFPGYVGKIIDTRGWLMGWLQVSREGYHHAKAIRPQECEECRCCRGNSGVSLTVFFFWGGEGAKRGGFYKGTSTRPKQRNKIKEHRFFNLPYWDVLLVLGK